MISGEDYPNQDYERVTTNFSVEQGQPVQKPEMTPQERQQALSDFVLNAAQVELPKNVR